MREIKFRAWTKEEMIYEGWNNNFHVTKEIIFRYEDVMQYTGLKDKNGKEIYEGDTVHSDGGITCSISWLDNYSTGTIGFYCTTPQGFIAALTPSTGSILEKVGNIYENP